MTNEFLSFLNLGVEMHLKLCTDTTDTKDTEAHLGSPPDQNMANLGNVRILKGPVTQTPS